MVGSGEDDELDGGGEDDELDGNGVEEPASK
jgi:hypothetical protein